LTKSLNDTIRKTPANNVTNERTNTEARRQIFQPFLNQLHTVSFSTKWWQRRSSVRRY